MMSGRRVPALAVELDRLARTPVSALSGRERQRLAASKAKRTHGMCHTSEYRIWQQMKNRCLNPKYHSFHRYGGRGIVVCGRWLASFEAFYEDMGPRPPGLTLERKDNDGPYCKENCRWATRFEQGQNKASTVKIDLGGEELSMSEASRRLGLKDWTLANRLRRPEHGKPWSTEEAMRAPVRTRT
jgi:hypothetical protein